MKTQGSNMADRHLDATAANLIVVHDKVLQILRGEIPLPEVVELFLTNYCMFACPFCRCAKYHGDKSRYLDFDILTQLLNELLDKGVKILELGGGGEPLEHPRIRDIFKRFIDQQFRVGVITNGYVMTKRPELADLLIQCADWVRFSIDAITDDVYRIVHGRDNLSYRSLRETIAQMAQKVRTQTVIDQRPKIGMKMIVQQPNEHQVLAAVDEAINLQVHYLQFKWLEEHPWSVPHERRPNLIERLNRRVSELCQESLIVDLLPGYGGERMQGQCVMSVLHPLVDWDGAIYICAFFHHRKQFHSIGNITNSRFFDCWGS